MNNTPKTLLNANKYSEDIMLLDRFLDKCFARNTFLGNSEEESHRLDIYIDKLISKDISNLRNVQKNTIKKIGSMIMGIGGDEFDKYRENHTGGESYDSVNSWRDDYMVFGNLILKNKKLLSGEKYTYGKPPKSLVTGYNKVDASDDFMLIYSRKNDNISIGCCTLDDNFVKIFANYYNIGLIEFYKLQALDNHDRFHNIDLFEKRNQNNEELEKVVKLKTYIDDMDQNIIDNYKGPTILGVNEQEYASLKEHQTHFTNAYRSNPEFEKYIYDTFGNLIGKLEDIASRLDNDGGYMVNDIIKIDGKGFMQYMLQYILTFFGRIWNIYEDKYIVGLMNKYNVRLLPLHEDVIKGIWSNGHHFKILDNAKLTSQEFYKIATYNN